MMNEQKDIFDRIAERILPGPLRTFFFRHKMVLMYLFFGGLSFFLKLGLFALLDGVCHIEELIANVNCWIVCVLFQFVTNRIWVFSSTAVGAKAVIREVLAFFGGRLLTLGFEELVLLLLIHFAHWDSTLVKLLAQLGVLVLNFVISKWMVFRKKKT